MISIASLIYRSPRYADSVWRSLHEHTPQLGDGRARFFFVANDAKPEVLHHLKVNHYPHVVQHNERLSDEELELRGFAQPEYIRRVYQGWNRAIQESDEEMVLVNSDMMFADGWLDALLEVARQDRAVSSQLVERRHPKYGTFRTAYVADFGDHPDRFKSEAFAALVSRIRASGIRTGGAYSPVLMRRSKALGAGLYPEGNLKNGKGVRYGDQEFFSRLAMNGVEHMTALDSLVYHFKEGEMSE